MLFLPPGWSETYIFFWKMWNQILGIEISKLNIRKLFSPHGTCTIRCYKPLDHFIWLLSGKLSFKNFAKMLLFSVQTVLVPSGGTNHWPFHLISRKMGHENATSTTLYFVLSPKVLVSPVRTCKAFLKSFFSFFS